MKDQFVVDMNLSRLGGRQDIGLIGQAAIRVRA